MIELVYFLTREAKFQRRNNGNMAGKFLISNLAGKQIFLADLPSTLPCRVVTGSEHEGCYQTIKKLVRNSENSKSAAFENISVLVQVHSFL